jgi:polysaccharide deacetylase family protein (PEP-CTERM system associated)
VQREPQVRHYFTVDVEEYFQVSALEPYVGRTRWDAFESRVESSVERLLGLLAENDARATFFVLGWVAERHPALVGAIARAGHEVASHGWDHRKVTEQLPGEFRESVRRSKVVLEGITGEPVQGFRAPNFSIVPGFEWVFDVLIEEGYRYDSRLFPVRRPGSGYPDGQRDPHWIRRARGRLFEVPPATLRCWWWNIPAAGGAYFRLLTYALTRAAFSSAERRRVPATFYVHPWEVDPQQPRLAVPPPKRLRHYGGLRRVRRRLQRLLSEFRFTAVADGLAAADAA